MHSLCRPRLNCGEYAAQHVGHGVLMARPPEELEALAAELYGHAECRRVSAVLGRHHRLQGLAVAEHVGLLLSVVQGPGELVNARYVHSVHLEIA